MRRTRNNEPAGALYIRVANKTLERVLNYHFNLHCDQYTGRIWLERVTSVLRSKREEGVI